MTAGAEPSLPAAVHPTAVIGEGVTLGDGVTVGPFCVIEGRVSIGAGTKIHSHTVIQGAATIGTNCQLGPHAAIGTAPQHLGYDGRETWLVVGDNTIIREFASIHRATHEGEDKATRIGSNVMIMAGGHVAHDCRLADHVIMANDVLLGGHVTVGERAFVGGGACVHQFCRVGRLAIVGGNEIVTKDILPFSAYRDGRHRAYNAVGVRRSGMARDAIRRLRAAFGVLHGHRTAILASAALRTADGTPISPEAGELLEFMQGTRRGVSAGSMDGGAAGGMAVADE